MRFHLDNGVADIGAFRQELLRLDAGGYCSFEGWVRNHHLGKDVLHLEYEAFAPLALKQGELLVEQALSRFDILDARVVHGLGKLMPGELAVWIGVCAVHRASAFEACRFLIDAVKDTVPVWKHEFYADGSSVWVDPTTCTCSAHNHSDKA